MQDHLASIKAKVLDTTSNLIGWVLCFRSTQLTFSVEEEDEIELLNAIFNFYIYSKNLALENAGSRMSIVICNPSNYI